MYSRHSKVALNYHGHPQSRQRVSNPAVLHCNPALNSLLSTLQGGTTPLDAFVVRWDPTADNAAPVPQIGVCMTYYGFMSDALRRSEMPRIKKLGPLKYTAAGAWQMLSLPFYNVDVEFLEFEQEDRRAWWAASSGQGSMREAMEAADRGGQGEKKRKLSDWDEKQQERLLNESQDEERRHAGIVWNVRARELGARWGKNEPPGKLLEEDSGRDLLNGEAHRRGGILRRAGRTFSCAGGIDISEGIGEGAAEGKDGGSVRGRSGRGGHRHTYSAPAKVGALEAFMDPTGKAPMGSEKGRQKVGDADAAVGGDRVDTGEQLGFDEGDFQQDVSEARETKSVAETPATVGKKGADASKPGDPPQDERRVGDGIAPPKDAHKGSSRGWVRRSGPFLSVMVCNHKCRSVQFLKTQTLAPEAEADDGYLDLLLVKPVGRVDLIRFLTLMQFSKHVDLPYVEYRKVGTSVALGNHGCGACWHGFQSTLWTSHEERARWPPQAS
jgi:hypothetical protein